MRNALLCLCAAGDSNPALRIKSPEHNHPCSRRACSPASSILAPSPSFGGDRWRILGLVLATPPRAAPDGQCRATERHFLWTWADSNRRPSVCQTDALPVASQARSWPRAAAVSRNRQHCPRPFVTGQVRVFTPGSAARRTVRPTWGCKCHPLWSSQTVALCSPALGGPFTCAGVTGLEPATTGFGDRRSPS